MGLCVAMIAFVRLPSLKVSCLLLSGLLIYDVFWVRYALHPKLHHSHCQHMRTHKKCPQILSLMQLMRVLTFVF